MVPASILTSLVQQLVAEAFKELDDYDIDVHWGRTSYIAAINWVPEDRSIRITCNKQTKNWHEAALIGLLSHELSHAAQRTPKSLEKRTDIDVIERGLGPYLALERALTGRYEDHNIGNGKDKYLGYRTIRGYLTEEESNHLDALLAEIRLVAGARFPLKTKHHELNISTKNGMSVISIDGHIFQAGAKVKESEVSIVRSGGSVYVYIKGNLIGEFDE